MTTNKSNTAAVILLVVAAAWFVVQQQTSAKTPTIPEPVESLRAAVAPVQSIHVEAADGKRLAEFYLAMADVVGRDQGTIATTKQLRDLNTRAGGLCFAKTGIQGRYAGLAEAIDNVLAAQVGLKVVPLDPAKRSEAVAALQAIAWALGG